MKGFVGVINLSSNQIPENIKTKLFENFSANNDLDVSKVIKENFLAYFTGDNCYYYEDHKSKLLTFFYGNIDNLEEISKKFPFRTFDTSKLLLAEKFLKSLVFIFSEI